MSSAAAHFEGCLLGAMIGDSLGSLVENASTKLVSHRYPAVSDLYALSPGAYGSTTEMTVALAESLAVAPDFDGEDFAARLVARSHDVRGYGQGTMLALSRLKAGVSWQEAGAAHAGRGCYGNAAAARSAPVGLVHEGDVATLRWIAEEAAGVTHTHAHAVEGAVVLALGVAIALDSRGGEFSAHSFFETIAGDVQIREYRSHLEMAASLAGRRPDPAIVADRLGNNQTALGSVVTALLCFADNASSFADAAAAALRLGGNASAIAAMTLALSGAHLGTDEIPPRWIEGLEAGEISAPAIRKLATTLAAAAR
ncbi:MAG TPA: ADP-ribosylglycohydrolase family protein [Candidatus Limnocylindrales bacterium]|nr:ADP-ribosylglycohydrolase family protein [Candidatus Limnocylindrales bacterium]